MFQILRVENCIGMEELGLCLSPLIIILAPSTLFTDFLLLNGETNLFANLDGENDLRTPSILVTDFLLFNGEANLFANLDGENDLRSFVAVDILGDFLVKLDGRVGDKLSGGLLIFT